jgi:neutral ceramidase
MKCQIVLIALVLLTSSVKGESWNVGVATRLITPDVPMWMAGYAHRDHPAEGTLTDLWAKAICLEDRMGQRCVLVTLDLVGIDRELSQTICNRLGSANNLSRSQIAICTSHTHTGPVVARNLESMHYALLDQPQRRLVEQYSLRVVDAVVGAVAAAIDGLEAADILWGSSSATFAVNRRNNPEPQVPELKVAGQLAGPVDHDVPVLVVRNPHGELRALVFGYACHATTLSTYQWSGDYPGFAQLKLEQDFPGCTALFWAGCGGDQNPLPRREVAMAKQYGDQLATAVKQMLEGDLTPIAPSLKLAYQEIDLPLATLPTRDELEAQAIDDNRYLASRARLLLARLDQGEPLLSNYPYPIASWQLGGEVQWVFLGGEVVVDYARRLKSELRGARTWVAGYSNDVMAYIPSLRVLNEGGYEGGDAMVYYGLPTSWAPAVESRIVEAVHTQLK